MSPAGLRRLRRLRDYADYLETRQRSNTSSGRIQAKISALRWALRMLEERFPAQETAND